jgi:hypothetical protein
MARKMERGNGWGAVYPRKNKQEDHRLSWVLLRPGREAALRLGQERLETGKQRALPRTIRKLA